MKSSRFDHALIRLLLVAVPFSCGGKTIRETSPSGACGSVTIVPLASAFSSDGGALADGGAPPVVSDGGTTLAAYSDAWCASVCRTTYLCEATLTSDGQPAVACHSGCDTYGVGCGRRPDGLPGFCPTTDDALQAYLERSAYLEAASVVAFRRLADELSLYSAPQELVVAARRAACEEEDHAARMGQLASRARASGALDPVQAGLTYVPKALPSQRSLFELARENAVEGCVRELLGALIASFQAEHAQDPELRAALQSIASEETGHARLAFAVAEWADGALDAEARAQVQAARAQAIAQLSAELAVEAPAALQQTAGWPCAELMLAWVGEAQQSLWI